MIEYKCVWAVLLASISLAAIDVQRAGWLDRMVQYHKSRFYNDVLATAPLEVKASIVRAPPGYVDSPLWNIHSVMHLLVLISEDEKSRPVQRALRRFLAPTRRIRMDKKNSFKLIPSLGKDVPNVMYYDMESSEEYDGVAEMSTPYVDEADDEAIVQVTNPVEARLPSAQISVRLLREILEARAEAARVMPSTTKTPIPWIPMTTGAEGAANSTGAGGGAGGNGTEAAGGAAGGAGGGAGDATTAAS